MEGRITKIQRLSLLASVVILFISANVIAAIDHVCSDCHTSVTPSASDLIRPLSGLCADCHRQRITAGEHAVDVPVATPTNTLPLHNGVMSCATCHDPHQPFAALRLVDPELCRQCHVK